MNDYLTGPMILNFIDNTSVMTDIVQMIQNAEGVPLILISDQGVQYNWFTIKSTDPIK